jgi:hypothetical protein
MMRVTTSGSHPITGVKMVMTINRDQPLLTSLIKGVVISRLNQVWASDITYIRILTGLVTWRRFGNGIP